MKIVVTGLRGQFVEELRAQGGGLATEPCDAGVWRLELPGLSEAALDGQANDEWLRLQLTPADEPRSVQDALTLNAHLPATIRWVHGERPGRFMLCSDLWLRSEATLATELRELCAGFVAAGRQVRDSNGESSEMSCPPASREDSAALRRTIDEGLWSVMECEGCPAVKLPVATTEAATAIVRSRSPFGWALDTRLPAVDGVGTMTAVGRYLLAVTAQTRGVKASAVGTSEQVSFHLSFDFARMPSRQGMSNALMALSVTWNRCAREVSALNDERVAEIYTASATFGQCVDPTANHQERRDCDDDSSRSRTP